MPISHFSTLGGTSPDRVLNDVVGHAVLESVLVAPLLYVLAYAVMVFSESLLARPERAPGEALAIHSFLAGLPVSFVLVFAALLVGHVAASAGSPTRSWPMLISAMVFASAGLTVTVTVLSAALRARRLMALPAAYAGAVIAAAILSAAISVFGYPATGRDPSVVVNVLVGRAPDGGGAYLGPRFWVTHLPFLPILVFGGGVVAAWLAKAVLTLVRWASGDGFELRRPMLMTAVLCGAIGAASWGVAAWI